MISKLSVWTEAVRIDKAQVVRHVLVDLDHQQFSVSPDEEEAKQHELPPGRYRVVIAFVKEHDA